MRVLIQYKFQYTTELTTDQIDVYPNNVMEK